MVQLDISFISEKLYAINKLAKHYQRHYDSPDYYTGKLVKNFV